MRVLLTGAFGNVGMSSLRELLRRGHQVTCFDLETKANRRVAAKFGGRIRVVWGDLRNREDVAVAVADQDVVIHLAFIIPPLSEARPVWAREINVAGTRHLLDATKAQPDPAKIVFSSSVAVFGPTDGHSSLRRASDYLRPTDHYTHHKCECEEMVRSSGLTWAILRLGAVSSPLSMYVDPIMFEISLDTPIEFVDVRDVGLAMANVVTSEDTWGKVLLIGGGSECQFSFHEYVQRCLGAVGLGMLPMEAFGPTPFYTNWMDTGESQRLLGYQRHAFARYVKETAASLGYRRWLIRLVDPLVRYILSLRSPYYRAHIRRRLGLEQLA